MIGCLTKRTALAISAAVLMVVSAASVRAVCVGDCDAGGTVAINEVQGCVNIFLGTSAVSTCSNCDQNGNGTVAINEVQGSVNSFLEASTCPMVTPVGGTPTAIAATSTPTLPPATDTPTLVPTNTVPAATNTPTRTATRTPTRTPSRTATSGVAVCGNKIKETGEDCDDGGTCIGGTNAGITCSKESDCTGNGVCDAGVHIGAACTSNASCPGGKCVHCKTFGGDGCAANCTNETTITYTLIPGVVRRGCVGGPNDGMTCTTATGAADCPGGTCFGATINPETTGSFVHDGIVQLALPISGQQGLTIGKVRDGIIPGVIKADSTKIPAIKVGTLACACVRSVPIKTCGGTLFDEDGTTFSTNCTPVFTAGDSLCVGKKPCTFVHGPGNSSSGIIGCNGLDGVNLSFTQDAGMIPGEIPPPAPTPQPNSKPPVVTLSGTGGPGSAILLNTSAIGTTTNGPNTANKCVGTHTDFGPDGMFCTDDDPQSARGTPQTLPQVTGTATGLITNTNSSTQLPPNNRQIGPFSYTGSPYTCANLAASPPSVLGAKVAGAFTALNQPATGDIVVRNVFVAGPPPTPTP